MRSRFSTRLVLPAAALIAVAAVAVPSALAGSGRARARHISRAPVAIATLDRHFSVLPSRQGSAGAHSASAMPPIPASVMRFLQSPAPNGVARGLQMNLTGYHAGGSATVWVVPGTYQSCVVFIFHDGASQSHLGAGCILSRAFLDSGDVAAEFPGSAVHLVGVVPDGNSTVTVGTANGARFVVPVSDNTWSASLSSDGVYAGDNGRTLTFRNSAGIKRTMPIP
jgi:hypothetical protein